MLTREQGIKAIIALQAAGGVTESEEEAAKGWDKMSERSRKTTEEAHAAVCGGFGEEKQSRGANQHSM